jgi:Family of unknown function (DUF5677)
VKPEDNEKPDKSGAFGSIENTHRIWLSFQSQRELLAQAYQKAFKCPEVRWQVVLPLTFSVLDTCESIAGLAQRGKMIYFYVLSRTVFETIVNICFILAKGDATAGLAQRHAKQKQYRDILIKLDINDTRLTLETKNNIDLEKQPDLKAALDEFTNKKGREITSWTPETVKEQVEFISKTFAGRTGINLQFALLGVYRHSSEIAHGTFFGALLALGANGANNKPENEAEYQSHQRVHLSMLMLLLSGCISSAIAAFAEELSINDLVQESKILLKELSKDDWVHQAD